MKTKTPPNIIGISGRILSGKDTVAKIIQHIISGANEKWTFEKYLEIYPRLGMFGYGYLPGWDIKKFAEKLKRISSILTGIPEEKFEDHEFKETLLGEEWNRYLINPFTYVYSKKEIEKIYPDGLKSNCWLLDEPRQINMSVREFLQTLGTECIRDHLHEKAWINAFWADLWEITDTKLECGLDYGWIITDTRFVNEADSIKEHGGIVIRLTRNSDILAIHPSETELDNYDFDYVIDNKNQSVEETYKEVEKMLKNFKIK
jgi:hypothetical protein